VGDEADQKMNGQAAAGTDTKRDAPADQPGVHAATLRVAEPAPEADEDLTEAGYGHGV
jgi:hypothetical protein